MKLSGFTLVRNGCRFDYPFIESIQSMLPLVDELVINVGDGDDETLQKIQQLAKENSKIRYFESHWEIDNPAKRKGGMILSEQTNLALDRCNGDWCLYLQADEVLHQDDYEKIRKALKQNHERKDVDGLLFEYLHFYGSYDVIQKTRSAYRREVRLIRKYSNACSVGDAQSFRKKDGSKLRVVRAHARIFHYGWVRPPEVMKEKTFYFDQLYHGDPNNEEDAKSQVPHTGDNYRYKKIWGLSRFKATHPPVMHQRIKKKNWNWDLKNSPLTLSWRDTSKILLDLFERATGARLFEYRSYRLVRK